MTASRVILFVTGGILILLVTFMITVLIGLSVEIVHVNNGAGALLTSLESILWQS